MRVSISSKEEDAQSGWSADISCEHPVGGPCTSGPMKVRRTERGFAGKERGHFRRPNRLSVDNFPFATLDDPPGRSSVTDQTGRVRPTD